MDSQMRQRIVRQYAERILHNPTRAQLDEAVTAISREWQRDVQDVHERAYTSGAEGELA